MNRIITILITLLLLINLTGCGSQSSTMKKVKSSNEFNSINIIDMDVEEKNGISVVNYYIVNNEIAQIDFVNNGHNYTYRSSKTIDLNNLSGITSQAKKSNRISNDGTSYVLSSHEEGLLGEWSNNGYYFSLFGEELKENNYYEFYRVLSLLLNQNSYLEEVIELPSIDENTTKDFIVEWFKENNFKDVVYYYEKSPNIKENNVISLSKEGEAYPSDEIICKISTGSKEPTLVSVSSDLINSKENEFLDYLNEQGLNPIKSSISYYSPIVSKDRVVSYNVGDFKEGSYIYYHLSKGQYSFESKYYDGLNKEEVIKLVEEYNKLNANINLTLNEIQTDSFDAGIVFDCSGKKNGFGTNVSCSLAKSTDNKLVDLPNYVGTYNNPCGISKSCSLKQIHYAIEEIEDNNPSGYISDQSVKTEKVEPGTCVTLYVSRSLPYLYRIENDYYQKYIGNSANDTIESLSSDVALGKFENVQYEVVKNPSLKDGKIIEIQIFDESTNTWISDYKQGNYSNNTKIKCLINDAN